ncbi:hypothetical protein SY27_03515 [Flavobacterium sp. 316]|uniref:Uncharacterized protein n=1 Tax=Flavobacterium sediminilitoris TaxID=2024526 RepID=A0ABY4HNU5_9FLAO|nr:MULTISPECIES: hypothetical protein [Flavobacterium]KIX22891.1 hypothetical protein SY27_03515 [Flavobacterium sp. 316]UOX33189.1 hypothetical protein LXD69_14225 [Flavobacterium sediminilitoris]
MFKNLDVIKILGYGISGFSFLLVLLTFLLLRAEQNKDREPRPLIITMIWRFMLMTIFMVILNGFISLPLFNRNVELQESVTQLSNKNNFEIVKGLDENNDKIDQIINVNDSQTNNDSIKMAMQDIIDKQNKALDSIKATLTIANSKPERIAEIENLKKEMAINYKIILDSNSNKKLRFSANEKIKSLNYAVKRVAITNK